MLKGAIVKVFALYRELHPQRFNMKSLIFYSYNVSPIGPFTSYYQFVVKVVYLFPNLY